MKQANISHLTDEERGLLDRCEAATPGPWQHGRLDFETYDGAGERVMYVYRPIVTDKSHDHDIKLAGEGCVEDAVFIAHAREDIPALLTTIDQLRGALSSAECLLHEVTIGADQVNAELAEGREALAELARVKGELEELRQITARAESAQESEVEG